MKLLQKTNRTFIVLSAILIVLSGLLLYFVITTIVKKEISEKLIVNTDRIVEQLEQGKTVSQLPPVIEVVTLSGNVHKESTIIKDTIIYDPVEEETEIFLEITSIRNINDQFYKITLRQVIVEPHDYYNSIGISLLIVLFIVLVIFYYINKTLSRKLWEPFYRNLETLKIFSLQDKDPINLQTSNIIEFTELNTIIKKLTEKVRTDYRSLKEFSENASHELQTPLAVIRTKLETLLNANNLSEEQITTINTVNTNINRLSKLNKDLLLLTKIENHQFNEKENVDFTEIILSNISEFSELIEMAGMELITDLNNSFEVLIDKSLARIIVSNLLSNAIKYTPAYGIIKIEIEGKKLVFSNTGESELKSNPDNHRDQIFQRFYKNSQSTNSAGLGLAIVKRICDLNNIDIYYRFQHQTHQFILEF